MPNLPEPTTMTINFDSHVIKVTSTGIADYEWTTSGQSVDVGGYGGTTYYATVTLEDGYEIANVTSTDSNYNLLTFSGNVISFRTEYSGMGSGFTITTQAAATKQTIDVSTLTGWANLATGNHQITIKTKASGYADSASSNAVTVSKAASGHTLHLVREEGLGPDPRFVISYNGEGEFEVPGNTQDYVIENVTTINSLTITIEMAPGYMGTIVSSELGISVPYDSTSAQSFPVITTATQLTQDTTITISTAASGETWVLNGMPNVIPSFDYYVTFESDGTTYPSISASGSGPMAALYYGNTKVYSGMDGWVSTVYQTITFGTSPSGDLLTWLQENAVKQ